MELKNLPSEKVHKKGNSIVTNEDNMQMMARYPDGFFDLAVVDPPYGIGAVKDIGRRKKWASYSKELHIKKDWDNEIPTAEYFNELYRVSKNQIIWGANYFELKPTKGIIAWDKICDTTSFSDFELAWTSFDVGAKIFRLPIQTESQNRIHPTQKPVALYSWILEKYAKEGDKILDTHLGSQSSRIAAYKKGFDFYGCELDPDYFKSGCERFEKEISMPLFDQLKENNSVLTLF